MFELEAQSAQELPPSYDDTPLSPALEERLELKSNGRVDVDINSPLARALSKLVPTPPEEISATESISIARRQVKWDIPLNIVIQVVGSRGDVQPFVALGNELQRHGHRIRIATHAIFQDFVRQAGLEFYSIGGDPTELMAYMVKNPGLIPSLGTIREGEIKRKRIMIAEMLKGCWDSCIKPDSSTKASFVAQAIIANPPSFAHVHCAQALGIPLHVMFTMPWSSTRVFPHPLANIKDAGSDPRLANYLSYGMVEWMTWQGIGDIINKWRKTLDLEPVPMTEGAFLSTTLKIPYTYCWSAALVPKPTDWAKHIDVCGFFFRETPTYDPPTELAEFLSSGPRPVYIGFGSIVIDDPAKLTAILLQTIEKLDVRAIVSRGWSKIGGSSPTKDVFYLDDCPHEWLFQRVSTVVHHGGAGTTACGLLNGCPTTIVPFFGDQPFWGQMIANAKAGPQPIAYKALDSNNLADAITYCLTDEAVAAAKDIASKMRTENGVKQAVATFHRQLPHGEIRCDLVPQTPASWLYTRLDRPVKLSHYAAEVLLKEHKVDRKHLKFYKPCPIVIKNRRWDPLTGTFSAMLGMGSDIATSTAGIFADPIKVYTRADKMEVDGEERHSQHADAALAAARSFGRVGGSIIKGSLVDVPSATAEGFRNAPRLWGGKADPTFGEVTDWKSGGVVAGKSFAYGMSDGIGGLFMEPYKGTRDEGALGFAKAFAKGIGGAITKPATGALGLVAYTGQGVAKTLHSAVYTTTEKTIVAAKRLEADGVLRNADQTLNRSEVLGRFTDWQRSAQESTAGNPPSMQ